MTEFAGMDAVLEADMAGGSVYTTIGQVRDIEGPSAEREEIDVTHRDSPNNWREFIKGLKNGGEITFDIVFDHALATHGSGTAGLWSDLTDDSVIPNWRIGVPSSGTISFAGFVTGYSPGHPLDDAQTADITIKVTSEPTFA